MLDYSKFKKVSEDGEGAVMAHPDGHRIHLSKSKLPQRMLEQLKALPLHKEGGGEITPSTDNGQEDFSSAPGPVITDAIRANEAQATPPPASPITAPPPAPKLAPPAPVDPNATILAMPGGAEELAANKIQTQALSAEAAQQAKIQHDHAAHEQQVYEDLRKDLGAKQAEIDSATKDVRKGHINPQHYMESKGAVGRVATAIGLLLGGISSGQTGQANPALVYLNKQIDNDLEAQKANLSNKHTLLSALHQQYGDRVVADNMFRAIRANTLASQVAEAAAKSNSQQAKAHGLLFTGQLKQQATQYMRLATLNGLRSSLENSPGGQGVDAKANAYLQAARIVDPKGAEEFEKRYIPSVGVASVPLDSKDREFIAKNDELRDLYKRAEVILSKNKGFGAIPGTGGHAEAKALQNQMQLRMGEIAGLNRFTGEENHIYGETVPDLAGTHFTGKDTAKMKQLMSSVESNINTFYSQKGIKRQAGDTDTIKLIHPKTGESGDVPKSQLQQALKAKYRQVQ